MIILVNAEAGRIPLPAGVVHCSVASPPYYSLRAYQGDQSRDWPEVSYSPQPGLPPLTIPAMHCALGHESSPEAFIGHLVVCYREVKRVLRDDGVCWVVIGDSYCSEGGFRDYGSHDGATGRKFNSGRRGSGEGLRPGDLMLIPHRLALALQGDGWTVRNDCVFAKVAPMPESVAGTRWEKCRVKVKAQGEVINHQRSHDGGNPSPPHPDNGIKRDAAQYTDCPGCPACEAHGGYVLRRGSWRHTRAHETILHLTQGMNYWSDQEAVREAHSREWFDETRGPKYMTPEQGRNDGGKPEGKGNPAGRNPRSVLTPKGEGGYPGAHYATFPTNLIRPLIKSSCPTRCCPACGSGWAPRIERTNDIDPSAKGSRFDRGKTGTNGDGRVQEGERYLSSATGYRPTCDCRVSTDDVKAEFGVSNIPDEVVPKPVPGIVLDPFFGSGTTGIVARELGVDCIGLDLSYDYLHDQARVRLGLAAWDAWHEGGNGTEAAELAGLPLFEGVE